MGNVSDDLAKFRRAMRRLRKHHGLSLQAVADATGYSKTHIWEMEQGRCENPSLMLAICLASLFKTTVSEMTGETKGGA